MLWGGAHLDQALECRHLVLSNGGQGAFSLLLARRLLPGTVAGTAPILEQGQAVLLGQQFG